MRLKLPRVLFLVLVAASLPLGSGAQNGRSFVIVVHESNPRSAITRNQTSMIFLKKTMSWEHGPPCLPIDLDESLETRVEFSREILGKRVSAVNAYWQQMIFSGRASPPPIERSEASVLSYVRSNPGAIGYVSPGATSTGGVKVLPLRD